MSTFLAVDCADQAPGTAQLMCSRCRVIAEEPIGRNWTVGAVLVAFCDRRAWQAGPDGRDPLCPRCAARATVQEVEQRAAARQARDMRILRLVLESFVPAQCCYVAGWSDQRVAEEAGAPVEVVAAIREGQGFKLLPSEAVRAAIKELQATKASMLRDLKAAADLVEEARLASLRAYQETMDRLRAEAGV